MLFLISVRSTLVTAISIPLSLLITFIGLWATDYSLNILTLGALTIAIGRVVDDSIVVIENIKRHLSYGEDKRSAIMSAIREVAGAVTASTLTTVAVFLPIAFVGNMAGELFRPFALTVTIALLASLAVSLTIVPVLAYWFLKSPPRRRRRRGRLQRRRFGGGGRHHAGKALLAAAGAKKRSARAALQRGYLPILTKTQRHPVITLVAGAVVLLGHTSHDAAAAHQSAGQLGAEQPDREADAAAGHQPGRNLGRRRQGREGAKKIDGVKDIQVTGRQFLQRVLRAVLSGASTAQFQVVTDDKADQGKLQDTVRNELAKLSDAGGHGQFLLGRLRHLQHRGHQHQRLHCGGPAERQRLRSARRCRDSAGPADISSNLSAAQPVVQVSVDRAKAVAAGLNEQQVAGILACHRQPDPGRNRADRDERLQGTDRPKGTQFGSIEPAAQHPDPHDGPAGGAGQHRQGEQVDGAAVHHQFQRPAQRQGLHHPQRQQSGHPQHRVQKRLASVYLPAGATAAIGGATTQQADSFSQLGLAMLAAIAIVYIIMVAAFKSLIQPLILLVSCRLPRPGPSRCC